MVPVWHSAHWNWTFRVTQSLTNVALWVCTNRLCATNLGFQSQMSVFSKYSFLSSGDHHSIFCFSVFSNQRWPCGYKACKAFFGNEHHYANCCLKESTDLRSAGSDWAPTEISCNAFLNTRRVCRTGQVCCIYWYKLLETKMWIFGMSNASGTISVCHKFLFGFKLFLFSLPNFLFNLLESPG